MNPGEKVRIDLDTPGPDGLRRGVSTGACATAAAQAGARFLLGRERTERVVIDLPDGDHALEIAIASMEPLGREAVRVAVVKRAGDELDRTDGVIVTVDLRRIAGADVEFEAGPGVGIVTRRGLPVPIGAPAINPVPRAMIRHALERATRDAGAADAPGWRVTIGCVGGAALARRTFNPRLGIVGGLSILGTTGLVEPRSEPAFLSTIETCLRVALADGPDEIVLAPGNIGRRFARERLALPAQRVVQMSNHVGFSIERVGRILDEFDARLARLWLVGHPGKIIKILDGYWNTHSACSGGGARALARVARDLGSSTRRVRALAAEPSVEAAIARLGDRENARTLWREVEARVAGRIRLERVDRVIVRLFALDGRALGGEA